MALAIGKCLPDFQLLESRSEIHRITPSVGFIICHMARSLILSEINDTID
jgi:hypothetical protein